jgi:hypothetical protein
MHNTITTTRIMLCEECYFATEIGDMPEDAERAAEVEAGMVRTLPKGAWLSSGDSDNREDFSWAPCECCGSRLGGSRHEAFICEPAD